MLALQTLIGNPPLPPEEPDVASLFPGFASGRCRLEGIAVDCAWAMNLLAGNTAARCPNDDCDARFNPNRDGAGHGGWQVFAPTMDPNEPWLNLGPQTKGDYSVPDIFKHY